MKVIHSAPAPPKTAPAAAEEAALCLRLFGPFEAQVNRRSLPRLRSRKGQWLLALLALRAGRAVERAWVAGTLWPDTTEENALVSLRQTLTDLRRALGTEAARLVSPTTRTLSFEADGAFVDALAFDAAIRQGDPASLERAAALAERPLLEDCLEEWALTERETRERDCLAALQTLASARLAQGEFAAAETHLRRLLAADPFNEVAARDLMTALARSGQWGAVVQAYRDLRLRLQRELRAEPSAETRTLYERLRAEGRGAKAALPETAAAAPLLPSASGPAGLLPRPLTELVGRDEEAATVSGLLFGARLVTLTGTGGVGKTRLSIRVAEAWAEDQPDGVWFVDLAPLTDPALVPQTVAATLGVRAEPGRPMTETLAAALRSRRLLLIWDNCEHLLPACAALAAALLAACPALRLLATSRQALGLTGETVWPVPSLSGADAAQLFAERAASVLPGFALTERIGPVVAQICRRLDGIPLAIELAAARVRLLSPEQIAARLDDRFPLLTGGSRAALPRQQTLQAAIDWSYDLLTEPERGLLMRLSVFAGGWTLEAAEAVCASEGGEAEVLDLLAELEEKSLVSVEAGDGAERRCRLLETLGQYARERLHESGQAGETARRHRDWAASLAETAEKQRRGPEAGVWLTRLEADHDNLRAALDTCRSEASEEKAEEGAEIGLRLAASLWRFWMDHGHYREGLGQLTRALERAGGDAPAEVRSKALNGAAALAWYQGDLMLARQCMEEGLALARRGDDPAWLENCLHNLGNVLYSQGERAGARSLWEESLAIRRASGHKNGVAVSLNNLGALAFQEGELTQARAMHREALALSEETGDEHNRQSALSGLGSVAGAQGSHAAARAYLEQSLALARTLGETDSVSGVLTDLGGLLLAAGDTTQAGTRLRESLTLARDAGLTPRLLAALDALAEQALSLGEARRAACLLGASEAQRTALALPRLPDAQARVMAAVLRLRERLDEDAFQAAWEQGKDFPLSQAATFALSLGGPSD